MGNKGYESLVHQWGVFRLPVFYVGIVVGQGMLHVRLTAQACVILGRIADVLSLLMVAAAFFPYSCNLMDPSTRIEFTMTDPVSGDTYTVLRDTTSCKDGGIWQITPSFVVETLHCPLLSFLLFVFCRAPRATLVGRFLGNRFLRELVPYTYAIYICHWIVIKWAKWARVDWLTFAPYSAVITLEIPRPPLHQVRSRGIRRIFPSRWATPVESLLGFPYLGGERVPQLVTGCPLLPFDYMSAPRSARTRRQARSHLRAGRERLAPHRRAGRGQSETTRDDPRFSRDGVGRYEMRPR